MLIGKYQVIRELTKTTLSIVYECEHTIKKTKAVIKMEKQSKLLKREAEIYLYLQNTKVHIPALKGAGVYEGSSYLVLSQLKESLLTYDGSIPYVTFFKEFNHLHEAKVVHRDIKPQNFLIGFKDDLYLIDFGLACFQTQEPMHSFIGNKRYASFTCFEKEYVYTYQDDLISLIYMLLDLTFGYLPWDKEEKVRKDYPIKDYYPDHILLDLYEICMYSFSYDRLFERLGSGIDRGNTQGK
jgi:serine/threonine protein kinase